MKRIGLAVGFAFLALVASEWFFSSAYADTTKIPPLTPIQEDDAVPQIAISKKLYERVTASDWQPAVTVTASVKNSKSKRYPKADFFCKQVKGTADIHFAAKPKAGTSNFSYARVTSIDCASERGVARMTGLFMWSTGYMWVGEVRVKDRDISTLAGLGQYPDKSVVVYRKSTDGTTELAATAGPQGATLLTTDGSRLFGYEWVNTNVYYNASAFPQAEVPARLIIPGVGYFEGRSSIDRMFDVGFYEREYPGIEGYGIFYAPDDSFRLIGPIFNEGEVSDNSRTVSFGVAVPEVYLEPESKRPETLTVDLLGLGFCSPDNCGPARFTAARNYIYMASSKGCRKGGAGECEMIRVETRVPTFLGPPGLYGYTGVVNLTAAPDLAKMLPGKWAVDHFAEPMTFAKHFQKSGQPPLSEQDVQQWQADKDEHYQTRLEQVEAQWAVNEKNRLARFAYAGKQYANSYAEMQAERRAERQADARRQAATTAAIMGAFSDLGQSAIGAAEDLNETRALVDRTNAASAGGAVAAYTPNVAAPLTEEQRQLIASRWGRGGGKSVASASSGQGYSGTSVSGSSSTSGADESKRVTQAEAERIMTSLTFVTEDGSSFATNGGWVELLTLATDRFWSHDMEPLKEMVVTRFSASDQSWNMEGRGICTNYLDMRDTSENGPKLAIDEGTGLPSLSVSPCTWNFVNYGASYDHYGFSAGPGMQGTAPK